MQPKTHDAEVSEVMTEIATDYFPGVIWLTDDRDTLPASEYFEQLDLSAWLEALS